MMKVLSWFSRNDYYSGDWASFHFEALLKWIAQQQVCTVMINRVVCFMSILSKPIMKLWIIHCPRQVKSFWDNLRKNFIFLLDMY